MLSDRHIRFTDDVQIIYGENESGKSTLHAFIRAMLFGMERGRGKAATKDDFTRYEPWENPEKYAGVLWFSCGGKRFRLERNFSRYMKRASLICEDDGEELSVEDGDLEMLLGDMTTDIMWHKNDFALRKYLDVMKTYPSPIFHLPGNHDNERFIDPEIPDAQWDSIAQRPYRQIIGPNYYSFNLGKVHFVMLDNIIVRKGELKNGKRPSRNDYRLDERQLRWLGRDLGTIESNTPLVVCMHVPIVDWTGISDRGIPAFSSNENQQVLYEQIMPLLIRFEDVRLLTGHSHRFINIPLTDRIFQHTLVSVSAVSWKINGPESRLISEDGSPGGYLILRYRGDRASWQFKPNGYRADLNQFRVYDLNRVPEEFGGQPGSNRCLINVYNWDEQWTVRVREKGRDLKVEQIWAKDPLYTLIRRDALPARPSAFRAIANPHMFSVQASSSNTPLDVIVTDRFGRKYRQMIERPKDFDWQIE